MAKYYDVGVLHDKLILIVIDNHIIDSCGVIRVRINNPQLSTKMYCFVKHIINRNRSS